MADFTKCLVLAALLMFMAGCATAKPASASDQSWPVYPADSPLDAGRKVDYGWIALTDFLAECLWAFHP